MMRSAIGLATAMTVLVLAAALAAQTTSGGSATRPVGPVVPSLTPSDSASSAAPTTQPVAPVVAPSTEPAAPVTEPSSGPAEPGERSKKLAAKYAKSLSWLKLAEREATNIDKSKKDIAQQRDYVYGVLMNDYIKIGDIAAARRAYKQISAVQQPFWSGGLIAGMLVQGVDQKYAMKMLSAISDANIRTIVLRAIAQELTKLDTLDALKIVRMLPESDQPPVLLEWIVGLTLEGRLVDARVAAEGANSPKLKEVTGLLDLAGRVMHGKKTLAQAQADSGKEPVEFMRYLLAVDWSRVKDLDPNVALGVLNSFRPDPARTTLDIAMAKNFIKQRKFKAAEILANAMVHDLRPVPTDKIPGPMYLDVATVFAGVGKFDKAKVMFERGLADPTQPLTVDHILEFFQSLINADGGDMADRLDQRMPEVFHDQIRRIWAQVYIQRGQADQVRALLAKSKTPIARACLYLGVAAGLQDLADKADKNQR